jgi:hypothetical protein
VSGYLHSNYAYSLSEFGIPRKLPQCGGWIIERPIAGFSYRDARGSYPIFACQDWSKLRKDIDEISNDLVSLALVTDPFGNYNVSYLHFCFPDVVIPFKQHFIIDLRCSMDVIVSKHHCRNVRKSKRLVTVERCTAPLQFLDDWVELYANLTKRHNIQGIAAFSKKSFLKQFQVPGIVVFRAIHQNSTVGMLVWYVQNDVGYYHLGAYNTCGYKFYASFGLFSSAIEYFASKGLQWLNLGAGPGVKNTRTDGLSRFKHGWSTGTRTAYFCGRIFNAARYAEIVEAKGLTEADYFPAYRGDFLE